MSTQQPARHPQALVDVETAVQVGIVDQSLPADRGARLLEVHAHDDLERALESLALLAQAAGVLQRRGGIVNRARTDHDGETIVRAVQDALQGTARRSDGRRSLIAAWIFARELFGRAQLADVPDAQVVGTNVHR